MKSKIRKIVALVALQLVCVCAFAGCGKSDLIWRLKSRYGVNTQLLEGYEIVCDVSGETFTGYAPHYAVIRLEAEPTAFLQSYFNEKENTGGFSSEKTEEIKNLIDGHSCMEIPAEYYPDWEDDYIWNRNGETGTLDNLYTVYFPNQFKLVFFEAGH